MISELMELIEKSQLIDVIYPSCFTFKYDPFTFEYDHGCNDYGYPCKVKYFSYNYNPNKPLAMIKSNIENKIPCVVHISKIKDYLGTSVNCDYKFMINLVNDEMVVSKNIKPFSDKEIDYFKMVKILNAV